MNFTECDVSARLAESREAYKRIRKLGMLWNHRLKELRHLRAVEKLATWRSNGFDQCDVHDGQ